MARVVLPTFTDAQRSERERKVLDCNTWLSDPHPAFSRLKHKWAGRGGRFWCNPAKIGQATGFSLRVDRALIQQNHPVMLRFGAVLRLAVDDSSTHDVPAVQPQLCGGRGGEG